MAGINSSGFGDDERNNIRKVALLHEEQRHIKLEKEVQARIIELNHQDMAVLREKM